MLSCKFKILRPKECLYLLKVFLFKNSIKKTKLLKNSKIK